MQPYILQDWTTIRGQVTTVTQGESTWLDLAPHQDIAIYTDVREYSGTTAPTLYFQTSPNKEDGLFQTMTGASFQFSSTGVTTKTVLLSTPSMLIPLARFVRWQLVGPSTRRDATFRVLV